MCEQIVSIVREVFPSPEMASYLAERELAGWELRDAIAYAAVPLERKRDMFLRLAFGKDTAYFRRQAGAIEEAIREMQAKPGEFFYLKYFCCSEESVFGYEEKGLEPYLTWEHIFECIQKYLGYLEDDEKELVWFEVEKWSPDGKGRLKNDYDYTVLGNEVCYVSNNNSHRWKYCFSTLQDLAYLPVPFHAGDIVTIDCRPFAPVSHAVILDVGDNRDCCCLQALYRSGDGIWDIGAVKHGHVLPYHYYPEISPLYRLASFHGQLPEEERLLKKVSQYVSTDKDYGITLCKYFFNLDYDRTVTEEQIMFHLGSKAKV